MLRFSLRELLLVMLCVGLAVGWWLDILALQNARRINSQLIENQRLMRQIELKKAELALIPILLRDQARPNAPND